MANRTASHGHPRDFRLQALLWVCASTIGRVPTLDDFVAWRDARHAQWPSEIVPGSEAYLERYGDWGTAVAAGDLRAVWRPRSADPQVRRRCPSALDPAPRTDPLRIDRSWFRASLRHCARAIGHAPDERQYGSWQAQHNGASRSDGRPPAAAPSRLAYIERYGDWPTALSDANLRDVAV